MRTSIGFRHWVAATTLGLALMSIAKAQLAAGQLAPDFSLRYATRDSISGAPLRLSAIAENRTVVLAFYPADWSGGCTKEVCSFRDDIATFEQLDVEVLAISGDYVYSHHAWAKALDLPFRLLSDHDHAVAKAYQSYNEATGYNRRTVFVVDRKRQIVYADLDYSVRDDVDFQALRSALTSIPR
ncbi:MAG: peroxiredoxin [Bacteroidetes bacterium]|jgi:peroxiredoxin Q/BCP|nr:peroxiredoxin [Bacteroidota bacterium]